MPSRIFMAALMEGVAEIEELEDSYSPSREFAIETCKAGTRVVRVTGHSWVFYMLYQFAGGTSMWSCYNSPPYTGCMWG